MGRSSGTNGERNSGREKERESRCTESGGETEARKTKNVMGRVYEERSGKSGRRMEKTATNRRRGRLLIENVVMEN